MAATDLLIGSLFSGAGGLDLGVQAALGGHNAWYADAGPRKASRLRLFGSTVVSAQAAHALGILLHGVWARGAHADPGGALGGGRWWSNTRCQSEGRT